MQKQNSMALKWCKEGFCPYLHPVGARKGGHPIGGTQLPGFGSSWVSLQALAASSNPPRFARLKRVGELKSHVLASRPLSQISAEISAQRYGLMFQA
jgi:hypothetical protein